METKKCSSCGQIKFINEFNKNRSKKGGYACQCKKCIRQYQVENKEYIKKYKKQYRKTHRSYFNKHSKLWKDNNKEYIKKYKKQYNITHLKQNREYQKQYYANNSKAKISNRISSRIWHSLINGKEDKHWGNLVGYSLEHLIQHLESKFTKDMTWDNYGNGDNFNGWHIDHIIPVSLWKFTSYKDREFKLCWALANLQPLWGKANLKKYNKCIY